jgi:D-sedoheptulose 7-phosphate isomerase
MIVFTNGCFDILHKGHIQLLQKARALGSKLIVGINSDESVRSIKGHGRPVFTADDRAEMLLALNCVDEVRVFDELTPQRLIEEIEPDVLVKGGDWNEDEIVGGQFVRRHGGKVVTIPLVEGYSTSDILRRLETEKQPGDSVRDEDEIFASLVEHSEVMTRVADRVVESIRACSSVLISTLKDGGKIIICGNGGSAADAQHIAAELVGRYENDRRALPAIALTTDTSALTALANDYDFSRIFARQVEALAKDGDCLIAISTSGESENVIAAVMSARDIGCRVVGMTGENGKKLASLSDACLMIPSTRTARIQEAHIAVAHIWCELIEKEIAGN